MKNLLRLLILGLIIEGCGSHDEKNQIGLIDLTQKCDVKEFSVSDFADSIEYIVLETIEESFIGQIQNIIIRDKYIIIQDLLLNKVMTFTRDGKYISTLGREGRGPQEHLYIFDIDADKNGENVFIYTVPDKLMQFLVTGEFVKEIKIPGIKLRYFRCYEDRFVGYITGSNLHFTDGYSVLEVNYHGEPFLRSLQRPIQTKHADVIPPSSWSCFENNISFWETGFDTIYSYNINEGLMPKYSISLQENAISSDDWNVQGVADQKMRKGAFLLTGIKETSKYIFFHALRNRKPTSWVYFKKTSSLVKIEPLDVIHQLRNDQDIGPHFRYKWVKDDYLIDVKHHIHFKLAIEQNVNSRKLDSQKITAITEQLNQESNPVIVLLKLK